MKDYAVKVSVRNGRILRRMRECGFESQAQLHKACGVTMTLLNGLICMRVKGYNEKGEWRKAALDISSALRCEPEELFNDQQRQNALERNSAEVYMDAPQVHAILCGDSERSTWAKIEVQKLLGEVKDARSRRVVVARMEGATLEELADEIGVKKERIRQIEQKAHRVMRGAATRYDKAFARSMVYGSADN